MTQNVPLYALTVYRCEIKICLYDRNANEYVLLNFEHSLLECDLGFSEAATSAQAWPKFPEPKQQNAAYDVQKCK